MHMVGTGDVCAEKHNTRQYPAGPVFQEDRWTAEKTEHTAVTWGLC